VPSKSSKLTVVIDAETRAFLRKFGNVKKVVSGAAGAIATGAVATAAALTYATMAAAKYGDAVGKMSKRTGIGTDELQRYQYAAKLSGASLDGVELSLKKMATSINEARKGTKTYKDALAQAGLKARDFAGKSPEEAFEIMLSAIANIPDELTKSAVATQLFGRNGRQLLPMLSGGAAGLKKMKNEADELGLVMRSEDVVAAEEFQDALERLQATMQATANSIGAGAFAGGTEAMESLRAAIQAMIESGALERIGVAFGGLAANLAELAKDRDNIEAMVTLIQGGAIAFEAMAKGTMAVVGGLAAIGKAAEDAYSKLPEIMRGPMKPTAKQKSADVAGAAVTDDVIAARKSMKNQGYDVNRTDQAFFVMLAEEVKRLRIISEERLPRAAS
jgi:hypothetical protein